MKIIAVKGQKGGVGKTTLAVNIAAWLARVGLRTLLVDADKQGNASVSVDIAPHDGLFKLLMEDREFADVLVPVDRKFHGEGELWLLSSWTQNMTLEYDKETPGLIYERFQELEGAMDAVVVDTSPGQTEIHAGLYYCADFVLLPTQLDWMSLYSLGSSIAFLEVAKVRGEVAGYPSAQLLGIVPNMFMARERVQTENFGWLKGKYDGECRVFDFLRNMTVWRQASAMRQSIYEFKADDPKASAKARLELQPVVDAVLSVCPMTPHPQPLPKHREGSQEQSEVGK